MNDDPYSRFAGFYDTLFERFNHGLRMIGLKMFRPREGMTVLDTGCGTGIHMKLYTDLGCRVTGIDTSPSMLAAARQRLGESADLRRASATVMPFDAGSFDLAVAMLVLHEMDHGDRLQAIAEMTRVIKPEGRILLIDFHIGPYRPLRGWLTKLLIWASEHAAGRRHFRNYRHFMSIGGLSTLFPTVGLAVEQRRIVGGGALALYLLRKADPV